MGETNIGEDDMAVIDEIHIHNQRLIELSNVLTYLLRERAMCETETACALLFDALGKIDEHMKMVDHLCQGLLVDKEQKAHNMAESFISGERGLKRIIAQYKKTWCTNNGQDHWVSDHEQFTRDTEELFATVLSRIQDENEHLYPHARKGKAKDKSAA